jgi:hypothetical protein
VSKLRFDLTINWLGSVDHNNTYANLAYDPIRILSNESHLHVLISQTARISCTILNAKHPKLGFGC